MTTAVRNLASSKFVKVFMIMVIGILIDTSLCENDIPVSEL